MQLQLDQRGYIPRHGRAHSGTSWPRTFWRVYHERYMTRMADFDNLAEAKAFARSGSKYRRDHTVATMHMTSG